MDRKGLVYPKVQDRQQKQFVFWFPSLSGADSPQTDVQALGYGLSLAPLALNHVFQ